VGVEKLFRAKFAKIKSRRDALAVDRRLEGATDAKTDTSVGAQAALPILVTH
jgi:hypothetical protein